MSHRRPSLAIVARNDLNRRKVHVRQRRESDDRGTGLDSDDEYALAHGPLLGLLVGSFSALLLWSGIGAIVFGF